MITVLEALSARGVPMIIYSGGIVPDDVRQRHPGSIVLSEPVLPAARTVGELRKTGGAFNAPSSHG
jgi:hypothetical protein